MAVEVVQFLVKKFVAGLAEEATAGKLPLIAQFYDIRVELEALAISLANADELRECLYELDDLHAECRMLTNRRTPWRCFVQSEAWRLTKTKKRLATVRRRVQQCIRNNPGSNGGAASREDGSTAGLDRWTTSWLERSRVHGFDQQLAELESVAFQDCVAGRLNGVGIVGMGGIGKTVLAQLLFNSPSARGHFCPRIWMCMLRTSCAGADVRKEVLQGMLMALGHEEDAILSPSMDDLGELVCAVHEQLRGKKFLIVFDDVWHVDDGWYADVIGRHSASRRTDGDWSERLAFGLPKERGGVVIVTSRLNQAAEAMLGKACLHRVRSLPDSESCWAIFMDAFSHEKMSVDLATVTSMKGEILHTCAGFPSAAKAMGHVFSRNLSLPASTSTSQELSKSNLMMSRDSGNPK